MIDAQTVGCGDRVEDFVRRSLDVAGAIEFTKVGGFFSTACFFRFRADGESYLLKIFEDRDGLRLDEAERATASRVGDLSLRVHAFDAALRAHIIAAGTIVPVPSGRTWLTILPRVGQALARLHEQRPEPSEPGIHERLEELMLFRERAYDALPIFRDVWSALLEVQPVLAEAEAASRVQCHNAMHTRNVVVGQTDVRFVNWEYATPGAPLFDLAAAIELMQLNVAQAEALLDAYFGRKPSDSASANLAALRIAACAYHALLLLPDVPLVGHIPNLHAGHPVLDLNTCLELLAADALDPQLPIDRWRLGLAFLDRARTLAR